MNTYVARIYGGFSYDKPELIHLETHSFTVKLKNADGTAADLSGFATAECAVGNTFDHVHNELMAYAFGDACRITDAAAGEIAVTLDCNTVKFGDVVRFNAQMAYLEINLFDTGAKMTRVLLDRVECRPHVRDQEGAPVSGDPQYYNKAEVDALISGGGGGTSDYDQLENRPQINSVTLTGDLTAHDLGLAATSDIPPAQVQSNWNETDTTSKSYIQNKPTIPTVPVQSVNGETGAVVLDASDVGAIAEPSTAGTTGQVLTETASGPAWQDIPAPDRSQTITQTGTAITPAPDAVFRHTLAANDSFTVDTSALTSSKQITFELQLIQPSTAVSFTLPSGILWSDGNSFSASNPVPEMTDANTLYCIVIRWDGSDLLANLAYSKEVSA